MHSGFLVDDLGNLWVAEFRLDGASPQRYIVFDNLGRFITTVSIPEHLRLMAISANRVFGRTTDSLDVQYVVGYEIRK